MPVRISAPFRLRSVVKDESRVPVVVKPTPQELIIRLEIDPADAAHADDWFSLRSSDGSYEQHRKIKDDHTPGDKFVDLLFTEVDTALKYSMEVDSRPHGKKHFLFEDVAYSELSGMKPAAEKPEEKKDPGTGEVRIRLEIDPAESPDDVFRMSSDGGYEQKKTVKDDQQPGDKFVDLLFTGLPRADSFTLEVNGKAVFHDVPYGELATLSGDHPPEGHDAGTGDFKVRLDVDPADLREAEDRFVLRGAGGYRQVKSVKDDQVAGDQCVDLHFTDIPRTESLTLEIEDARGKHTVFADVGYTDLAHLSGDGMEPEIRVHEMIDENPGAPAE